MTMLGATSVSLPTPGVAPLAAAVVPLAPFAPCTPPACVSPSPGGRKSSYWPRTRDDRYARMRPAWTPVTRAPTQPITWPPGTQLRRSAILSASGSSTTWNPPTLALIHPGRSTTATGPTEPWLVSWVTSRTGCWTTVVRPRSSATTARASVRLTCGPCLANRTPVEIAVSQSIICVLLTVLPYVLAGANGRCDRRFPARRLLAAASREPGGGRVDRVGRVLQQAGPGHLRCHDREDQQPAAAVVGEAGQRGDRRQVPGLGPHHPAGGSAGQAADPAEVAVARRDRPGEARHRQTGDDRPKLRPARREGQPPHHRLRRH